MQDSEINEAFNVLLQLGGCEAIKESKKEAKANGLYTQSPYYIPSVEQYCINEKINYSLEDLRKNAAVYSCLVISIYYRSRIPGGIMECSKYGGFNLPITSSRV